MEKIKEKIRNIIDLMEGAKTEGEAKAASLALQRLLAKYHLTMSDIEVEGSDNEVQESEEIAVSEKWKEHLAYCIAKNMRCLAFTRCYKSYNSSFNVKYTRKVVLVGLKEDLYAVEEFFNATVVVAKKLYRSFSKEFRENSFGKQVSSQQRKSWYFGFVYGLDSALEEQRQSNEEMAIVLQTPKSVEDYFGDLDLVAGQKRSSSVDEDIYNTGYSTGKDYGSRDRLAV